ncbi:MAG: hypothetical protein R3B82_20650, partial [Sandaracinaceae bacterium]
MGGARPVVLALALAMVGGWSASAHAQDAPADPRAQQEEARARFAEGMAHAEHERWVEALEAFERSAALYDRVSTHINLASVLLRLGRLREARV